MARRRYYYRRLVRPKQKWATNAAEVVVGANITGVPTASFYAVGQTILQNGDRINADASSVKSSAQILKTGRFRFKGVIPAAVSQGMSLLYFITYVPEGASALFVASGANAQLGNYGFYTHPEWVMAWGRKDYIYDPQSNEISLTSRLKRNLNSGDSVMLILCWINRHSSPANTAAVQGTVSYMCRAN